MPGYCMMNTMKYANMNGYLDEFSSEVIISKITRGKSFHPAHIDLLKKEIDGYLKLSEHFRDYTAFTSFYGEVQQELLKNKEANKIREKKYFGMPLFLFRVIVSLIKERDLATRILVQKLHVVNHLIPTQ